MLIGDLQQELDEIKEKGISSTDDPEWVKVQQERNDHAKKVDSLKEDLKFALRENEKLETQLYIAKERNTKYVTEIGELKTFTADVLKDEEDNKTDFSARLAQMRRISARSSADADVSSSRQYIARHGSRSNRSLTPDRSLISSNNNSWSLVSSVENSPETANKVNAPTCNNISTCLLYTSDAADE